MTDAERALLAMHDVSGDFGYLSFKGISGRSGLAIDDVRPIVRDLAARGLATFGRGLVTEDGDFYGSGYALTDAGAKAARGIDARQGEDRACGLHAQHESPFGTDVPTRPEEHG